MHLFEHNDLIFSNRSSEIQSFLNENIETLRSFVRKDQDLENISNKIKTELMIKAIGFNRSVDIDIPNPIDLSRPIIGSGHQPYFFSLGVMSKLTLLRKLAADLNATAIFVTVDSDKGYENRMVSFPFKNQTGSLEKIEKNLFDFDLKTAYEDMKNVNTKELIENLESILSKIKNSEFRSEPIETFIQKIKSARINETSDYADLMIILRSLWENNQKSQILEIKLSQIAEMAGFKEFVYFIVKNIERFAKIYNEELDRYRKEKNFRYQANPFPNLFIDDSLIELPFWMKQNKRAKLFIDRKTGNLKTIDNTIDLTLESILEKGKIKIRPKAITLTLFLRMFLFDLFIHGTGGAKYDQITDKIIEKFYAIKPPKFVTISASINYLDLKDPDETVENIKKNLRNIEQKPEIFKNFFKNDKEFENLVEKKKNLVDIIRSADNKEKKLLSAEIYSLNLLISQKLDILKLDFKEKLAAIETQLGQIAIARSREYPYFLYDRSELDKRIILI